MAEAVALHPNGSRQEWEAEAALHYQHFDMPERASKILAHKLYSLKRTLTPQAAVDWDVFTNPHPILDPALLQEPEAPLN